MKKRPKDLVSLSRFSFALRYVCNWLLKTFIAGSKSKVSDNLCVLEGALSKTQNGKSTIGKYQFKTYF